ncbi:MAG: hypothetical protein RR838_04050 [Clostridium sp.]
MQKKKITIAVVVTTSLLLTTVSPSVSASTTQSQELNTILSLENHPIYIKMSPKILALHTSVSKANITKSNMNTYLGEVKKCRDMVKPLGTGSKKLRHALNNNINIIETFIKASAEANHLIGYVYPASEGGHFPKVDPVNIENWNTEIKKVKSDLYNCNYYLPDSVKRLNEKIKLAEVKYKEEWGKHTTQIKTLDDELKSMQHNISIESLQALKSKVLLLPQTKLAKHLIEKIQSNIDKIRFIKTQEDLINLIESPAYYTFIIDSPITIDKEIIAKHYHKYVIKKSGSLTINSSSKIFGEIYNHGTVTMPNQESKILFRGVFNYGNMNIHSDITGDITNYGNYTSNGAYYFDRFNNHGNAILNKSPKSGNDSKIYSLANYNEIVISEPTTVNSFESKPNSLLTPKTIINSPMSINFTEISHGDITNNSTLDFNYLNILEFNLTLNFTNNGVLKLLRPLYLRGNFTNNNSIISDCPIYVPKSSIFINNGTISDKCEIIYSKNN